MVKHQGSVIAQGQAVTTTVVATDHIDLLQARDLGQGEPSTHLNAVQVTGAATPGNATVVLEIVASNNPAHFSGTAASTTVLAASRPYTYAELAIPAGATTGGRGPLPIALKIPPNLHSTGFRYISARFTVTVGTGTLTGSTWNAWFGPNHVGDARKFYPAGY